MLLQIGNPSPHQCLEGPDGHIHVPVDGPAVTYMHIPDGQHEDGTDLYGVHPLDGDPASAQNLVKDLALHLARNPSTTRLAGHEAFLSLAHPTQGAWQHHGADGPSWIWSDHQALADTLAAFYGCPTLDEAGLAGIEDSHYTRFGGPGVVPGANLDITATISQNGRDIWSNLLGGGQVGAVGQATASSTTTLTTQSTYATNQWAGYRVAATVSGTAMVWGNIVSNTNTTNASVLTVDRWYTPSTPGGAAGSTPSASATFIILDGAAPAWFMGLSTSTSALTLSGGASTATSLPSEITTSGGGLVRKICPFAHTASANTYTLTPVYTANGTDSLPVTIGSIGVFNSMVPGDTTESMLFQSLLSTTATLSASGDQLTLTETVTGT